MSGNGSTATDLLWRSLNEEDDGVFPGDPRGAADILSGKTKARRRRKDKPRRRRFAVEDIVGRPFDIDAAVVPTKPLGEERNPGKEDPSQRSEAGDDRSDLLCALDFGTASWELISDGDSDDDDEDATKENILPPQRQRPCRIARVANALGSDDAASRVASLTQLQRAIEALASRRAASCPELEYAPPYDERHVHRPSRHNPPLVSDLAAPHLAPEDVDADACPALEETAQEDAAVVSSGGDEEDRARLQAILDACGKALFRLVGDERSEKCRLLALECLQLMFLAGLDLGRHIPYLVPALCARYPPCAYDKDVEVFVQDQRSHEFYKRGGATGRQDRDELFRRGGTPHRRVVERSEEVRLALCTTFSSLVRNAATTGALGSLRAYYPDVVLSLQTSLGDPCPDVQIAACRLLVQLQRVPPWGPAARYFATGLARSALSNFRGKGADAVIAAMDLFEASVCVPDPAKAKGAGSAAIHDLVGYREENVRVLDVLLRVLSSRTTRGRAERPSAKWKASRV